MEWGGARPEDAMGGIRLFSVFSVCIGCMSKILIRMDSGSSLVSSVVFF